MKDSGLWSATPSATVTTSAAMAPRWPPGVSGALSAEGNHDEGHFEAFEQHRFVREPETDVVPAGMLQPLSADLGELTLIDEVLVVQRDDPGEPQDGLAEPTHAEEQQQNADDDVKGLVDLVSEEDQGGAEDDDDDREGGQRGEDTPEGRTPAAGVADGEDDGEGLHPLDEAGEERWHRRNREGDEHRRSW